jgi:hypothetical protein
MKICHMDPTSVWQTRKPCPSIDILIRDQKHQTVPLTQWPWTSVFEAGIIEGQCHLLYTSSFSRGRHTYLETSSQVLFHAVDGNVLQSRENGVEERDIVQNATLLER